MVSFLDTLQRPQGLRNFVEKCFDIQDQIQWMDPGITAGRLENDNIVVPVYAVKYTANEKGINIIKASFLLSYLTFNSRFCVQL